MWVGQDVSVLGIGGKWHVQEIKGMWIWVYPLDTVAKTFGRLGEDMVGFRAADLTPYQNQPGAHLT